MLIPSTSKGRNWTTIQESYLFKHTLKSFLLTYDKSHKYTFYIGIDRDDRIYDNKINIDYFIKFAKVMINIDISFVYMDNIPKGHLTVMWNKLFKIAYDDECEYFFQCGDDIEFKTNGWVEDCISKLQENNNIGLVGPVNNNPRILTQSFVSKKHMELFGYYFPPEIINWFCDDWINEVYRSINKFFPLENHLCINVGGTPRYNVNNKICNNSDEFNIENDKMRNICTNIVKRDVLKASSKL